MVVVGSAFGPSSAPKMSAIMMIANTTIAAMIESLATAYGKNGLPCRLVQRVLAEVLLLLALVHTSSVRSSGLSGTFSHGGAVVPSLATRYRWKPIIAAIAPGTSSMWIA